MLRDRRFIGALLLAFVAVGAWNLYAFRDRRAAPVHGARQAAAPTSNLAPWRPAAARGVPQAVPVALPANARNPFLTASEQFGSKSGAHPTETKGKGDDPLYLEGIALYGGVRAALIQGEPVREGAFFGNTQVVRVEENQVTFARDGRVWRVVLPPAEGPSVREDAP